VLCCVVLCCVALCRVVLCFRFFTIRDRLPLRPSVDFGLKFRGMAKIALYEQIVVVSCIRSTLGVLLSGKYSIALNLFWI